MPASTPCAAGPEVVAAAEVVPAAAFLQRGKAPRKSLEILNTINPQFAVDILVRTPEQVQQRLAWNDFFLQEILEKGKVLYEAAHT